MERIKADKTKKDLDTLDKTEPPKPQMDRMNADKN